MEGTSEKNDEDRKEAFSSFSGGDHLRLQRKKRAGSGKTNQSRLLQNVAVCL